MNEAAKLVSQGFQWDAVATLIQAVATLVALVGVSITFIYARRGQKQSERRIKDDAARAERAEAASEASATRAENAASLTIDSMDRIAEALETIVTREGRSPGETLYAAAMPSKVSWSLAHFKGDTYILTNTGDTAALRVTITAHESLMRVGELPPAQDLQPGEAFTFMAAKSMATTDSTITVRWALSAKEATPTQSWKYPLPPRPPR